MLGGGNPVGGSNPVGIGQSLNVIGNHMYGTNRIVCSANTNNTFFDHTNGAYYAIIEIAGGRNMKSGAEITTTVNIDGEDSYEAKFDNGTANTLTMPFGAPFKVLIAPFSRFKLIIRADDAEDTVGITVTGRIYA
jgi:hypothetical protein